LKEAIRAKKPKKIQCDADELPLYLGKKADNNWLSRNDPDVKKLINGEKTDAIKVLTSEDKQLYASFEIQKVLAALPTPTTEQIHILVVVPTEEVIPNVTAKPLGPAITVTSAGLLEFLESEMEDSMQLNSVPRLLSPSNLAFQLSGREKALEKAADCMLLLLQRQQELIGKFPSVRGYPALGNHACWKNGNEYLI
jgi:hypothetical protein